MAGRFREVALLAFLCGVGGAAVVPYLVEIFEPGGIEDVDISRLMFSMAVQSMILGAVLSWLGLIWAKVARIEVWVSHRVEDDGFEMPRRHPWGYFASGGFCGGILVGLLDIAVMQQWLPEPIRPIGVPSVWSSVLASIYGGINEEVMMRLFLLSGLCALFHRLGRKPIASSARSRARLVAVFVVAVVFGVAHLPNAGAGF